jgi:hypothetical protein
MVIANTSVEVLRRPLESALRSSIRVMDAAWRWLAPLDRHFQGGDGEPGVQGPADGVADDAARPGVQDHRDVDEAGGDRDIGKVGNPQPIGAIDGDLLPPVAKDRLIVVAVRRPHEPPARPRLEAVLTHQPADPLVVGHDPLLAQRRSDAAPAIGLERVANAGYGLHERRVVELGLRSVVVGRACNAHQPTSFGDAEPSGPVITHVGPLLGRSALLEAPFRNSSSRACLPTSRSRAAIRAS